MATITPRTKIFSFSRTGLLLAPLLLIISLQSATAVSEALEETLLDMQSNPVAAASKKPVKDAVTVVTTADAFIAAVKRGDAHIEVQEHIQMPPVSWTAVKPNLGDIPLSVLSITGNCPKPPSSDFVKDITGPALLPTLPGQCMIVSDAPIMNVRHGNLLIDNLYFRRRPNKNHRDMEAFIVQDEGRFFPWTPSNKLWMTKVTFQGGNLKRDCTKCAFDNYNAKVYAEGCVFSDFFGDKVISQGDQDSSSNFVGCTFQKNTITKNTVEDYDHSIIHAATYERSEGSQLTTKVLVRLESCSFENNNIDEWAHMLVASDGDGVNEAVFYSDVERDVFMRENWNLGPPRHMAKTHPLKSAPGSPFLTANDKFLVEIRKQLPSLPRKPFS